MGKITVFRAIVLVCIALLFDGCATMRENAARRKEDLMIAAGFTPRIAGTPEEKAQLESMKPLKMHSFLNNNTLTYVFPDPKGCNCAYVGNQTQYAEYRKLAVQKEIAEERMQSEQWNYGYPPYWGWGYGWGPGPGPWVDHERLEHER